jgi:hypothetical protein
MVQGKNPELGIGNKKVRRRAGQLEEEMMLRVISGETQYNDPVIVQQGDMRQAASGKTAPQKENQGMRIGG